MVRKAAFMGLLSALAIILGYVETLLPVFVAIPGIKLGLANLVTVFLRYQPQFGPVGGCDVDCRKFESDVLFSSTFGVRCHNWIFNWSGQSAGIT